jgi:hypothetical protein
MMTGPAVAAMGDPSRVAAVIDEAFRAAMNGQVISMLSGQARYQLRDAWSSIISVGVSSGRWSREQVKILVLFWPDERETWEFISSLGVETEKEYWAESPIQWIRGSGADLDFAAQKLLEAARPLAAIRAMHHSAEKLSAGVIFELLDRAVDELNAKPSHASTNLAYEIDDLLDSLRNRPEVSPADIARREYAYLPLFGYLEKKLTIHGLLAEDPSLFVSILIDVFKPESGEKREPTDEQVSRAKTGFRLLSEFKTVPGVSEQGFDPAKLAAWIAELRKIAKENDRARIADEYVGKVIAYTPVDADGMWPDRRVAEQIEELASDKIEQGISIERFNLRGMTVRGPFEGGDQERELAGQIRNWTDARKSYPRTFSLLRHMVESWQREADREDERARQDAMRFE